MEPEQEKPIDDAMEVETRELPPSTDPVEPENGSGAVVSAQKGTEDGSQPEAEKVKSAASPRAQGGEEGDEVKDEPEEEAEVAEEVEEGGKENETGAEEDAMDVDDDEAPVPLKREASSIDNSQSSKEGGEVPHPQFLFPLPHFEVVQSCPRWSSFDESREIFRCCPGIGTAVSEISR